MTVIIIQDFILANNYVWWKSRWFHKLLNNQLVKGLHTSKSLIFIHCHLKTMMGLLSKESQGISFEGHYAEICSIFSD